MMSREHSSIASFVKTVRKRLNRHRLADASVIALLVAGILAVSVGLYFILRGFAVPLPVYLVAGFCFLAAVPVVWFTRRYSIPGAAHFADRFFGLKDSLSSHLHFHDQGKTGEFVQLQAETAADSVSELDVRSVKYQWPRKVLAAGAILAGLSVLMAFKEASPEILSKQQIEKETAEKTVEIKEFLEEEIDELEEELKREQNEEIDPDQLREMLAGLEPTKDRQAAMRQYAELERKMREAAQKLNQRKEEQMLAKVGESLEEEHESRELGRKLKEKNFREAAEKLQEMAPTDPSGKKLDQQRKELAKLKAAAQRMASAAKSAGRRGSSSSGSENTDSGKAGQSSGSEMEGMLSQLDKSAQQLDQALKYAMKNLNPDASALSECKSCSTQLQSDLDKLCKSLCKLGAKCDAEKMLLSMCKKTGQCQGFLCNKQGLSLSQCLSPKAGGHKAGQGSTESRRDPISDGLEGGELSSLQGIKGQGPSQSSVESAEDGDGVSSRRSVSRQREFAKQMESFVQREDVPDAVKDGVREYFESIHQANEK